MTFWRAAEDVQLAGSTGSGLRFLFEDARAFILDETEDGRLFSWPPKSSADSLLRFLVSLPLQTVSVDMGQRSPARSDLETLNLG